MNTDKLYFKYLEQFYSYEKGYITIDELYLNIYLGEGLMTKKEYDKWMEVVKSEHITRKVQ